AYLIPPSHLKHNFWLVQFSGIQPDHQEAAMRLTLLLIGSTVTALSVLSAFYPAGVLAQPSAPAAAANSNQNSNQSQQTPAAQFVQNMGNKAIVILADKNMALEQRKQKYRDILRDSFDLETIGHFVLGRSWNSATPEQQQTFMKLFEEIVLETYGDRLN